MSLFWYPELNEKYDFEGKPDKGMLLSSYVRYYLARLQSMFVYDGLPESIPQKWLENYLLVNGSCVWIETDKGLIVTCAGIGGDLDEYFIPRQCIVTNPYIDQKYNKTYIRDEDCVLMFNDTYAQGLVPMLRKYCGMMVEAEISLNLNCIMSRGTAVLSAADDNTKKSAEIWLKRVREGQLGVIGESPFLIGNQDRALTVNQMSGADTTITNLIEYMQYIKASLYNELGLQSNYNMKREAINSGESQLNEDMLHPLIDDMLRERQEALEKVNEMFGTNISVSFNSAWEINEREEEAAIEQIEAAADQTEAEAEAAEDQLEFITEENYQDFTPIEESDEFEEDAKSEEAETSEEVTEEVTEEPAEEEQPDVEVTISDDAITEIAEKVAELIEEGTEDEDTERKSDDT